MGSWSSIRPQTMENAKRLEDYVQYMVLPKKKWLVVRAIGPVLSVATHWIPIKKKDGKPVNIPKTCKNWSDKTQSYKERGCLYCKHFEETPQLKFFANFIVRPEQDDQPNKLPKHTPAERKKVDMCGYDCYVKDPDSRSWSPVFVLGMPSSLADKIQTMNATNTRKTKKGTKAFGIEHPKYGRDISIMFDPKGTGTGMYSVQKEGKTSLTDEELDYLMNRLDNESLLPESDDRMKREVANLLKRSKGKKSSDDDDDSSDDDDDDVPLRKVGGKKGKKSDDDDDDSDDYDDVDDDSSDDDDDDEPKKKKGKKRRDDDDDDSDDDDEDNDGDSDDDDDEPKRKKGKGKKRRDDDDDDSDDDDEDNDGDSDDDEDDEPKRKKGKGKSKKSDDDDEDEDSDDDEDIDGDSDDDDEPRRKGKGKKGKKKRSAIDELDDD